MKKLSFASACLLVAASLTSGQSLADLAKKEKERRKNVEKDAPVRVITDEDLGTGTPESDGERAEVEAPTPTETESSVDASVPSSRDRMTADPWNEIFAGFREAYFEARQALETARGFQSHCENGTEPPPLPPVEGGFWMLNCDGIPADIERIMKEMNEIQEECFDQARRMGVPPGRARLNQPRTATGSK
jgi:hypothetical protein